MTAEDHQDRLVGDTLHYVDRANGPVQGQQLVEITYPGGCIVVGRGERRQVFTRVGLRRAVVQR